MRGELLDGHFVLFVFLLLFLLISGAASALGAASGSGGGRGLLLDFVVVQKVAHRRCNLRHHDLEI